MKYLKLFENFDQSEIDKICKKYKIKKYIINPDGSIDVDDDVDLSYRELTKLPLKFNRVNGNFSCNNNQLTSLEGCPKEVCGSFGCSDNKLTNLIGCPNYVVGPFSSFYCYRNNLTSLEGCPSDVVGSFLYSSNPISTIIDLFKFNVKIYLEYQETYNFVRKDCKIVKHLLEEALKDFNEYYNRSVELPEKIKGYTYI
jgi:hypothetical protein